MKFFTEFIVSFLKLLSSKLWEKLNFERWNLCTYHSKNDLSRPDIDRESRCLFRKILNKIARLRVVLQKDMPYLLSVSWPVIFWNFYFFFIGHISLHVFWTLIMLLYIEWPSVNSNEVQFKDQIKVLWKLKCQYLLAT